MVPEFLKKNLRWDSQFHSRVTSAVGHACQLPGKQLGKRKAVSPVTGSFAPDSVKGEGPFQVPMSVSVTNSAKSPT